MLNYMMLFLLSLFESALRMSRRRNEVISQLDEAVEKVVAIVARKGQS